MQKCKCNGYTMDNVFDIYMDAQNIYHTTDSCGKRSSGGELPPLPSGGISSIGAILTVPKASKNDQSKLDISLIPYVALREEATAFMVGQKKYGRYNYCKGHEASQLVAAAQRHLLAWFNGEDYDPTDGQHHLGSVRACCAMILRQSELGTLIDNRYGKETPNADNQK